MSLQNDVALVRAMQLRGFTSTRPDRRRDERLALDRVLAFACQDDDHLDGGARALDASEALRDDECDECDGCGVRTCGSGPMCGAPCGKCSGAGVSAEALREARVQGMRDASAIMWRWIDGEDFERAGDDLEEAIEAVRGGER